MCCHLYLDTSAKVQVECRLQVYTRTVPANPQGILGETISCIYCVLNDDNVMVP